MIHRVAALACALAPLGLAACGVEPGSGACTETAIAADPVTVAEPTAPLTLTATLTAGDTPVAGAQLAYFVRLTKAGGSVNGVRMGEARTDGDGAARYRRQDGVDGLGFSDERPTGYTVEFNPLTEIDGVQYCRSRVTARMTVR